MYTKWGLRALKPYFFVKKHHLLTTVYLIEPGSSYKFDLNELQQFLKFLLTLLALQQNQNYLFCFEMSILQNQCSPYQTVTGKIYCL